MVVALLRLGQERGLDRLPLHLPQVRFEVNVRPLERKNCLDILLRFGAMKGDW